MCYLIGVVFITIASKKHKLSNRIDVVAEWAVRVLGKKIYILGLIVALFLLFFAVVGSYRIFGIEHIYIWIMVFIVEINLHLIRYMNEK